MIELMVALMKTLSQDDIMLMDHMASDLTETEIKEHVGKLPVEQFERMIKWVGLSEGELKVMPRNQMVWVHEALKARELGL